MYDSYALSNAKTTPLVASLALADAIVYKTYLDHLNEMEVVPCPKSLQNKGINDI